MHIIYIYMYIYMIYIYIYIHHIYIHIYTCDIHVIYMWYICDIYVYIHIYIYHKYNLMHFYMCICPYNHLPDQGTEYFWLRSWSCLFILDVRRSHWNVLSKAVTCSDWCYQRLGCCLKSQQWQDREIGWEVTHSGVYPEAKPESSI